MAADSLPERVGRLETSVTNLHSELGDVKLAQRMQSEAQAMGFKEIQSALNQKSQINLPLVGLLIALTGSIYGLAIAPLKQDIERSEKTDDVMAEAVLVRDNKIANNTALIMAMSTDVQMAKEELRRLVAFGSPSVDKRLAVIEYRLDENNNATKQVTE